MSEDWAPEHQFYMRDICNPHQLDSVSCSMFVAANMAKIAGEIRFPAYNALEEEDELEGDDTDDYEETKCPPKRKDGKTQETGQD